MAENLLDTYMVPRITGAPAPDVAMLELCKQLVQEAKSADIAACNFEKLRPLLEQHAGNLEILKTGADLLERKRIKSGMLETWTDLHIKFPQDGHLLRMRLRWLRRGKYMEEGFVVINQSLPDRAKNVGQAVTALLAYSELQAFGEIDVIMEELLPLHPADSKLRILYAKNLMRQNRFIDAHTVVKTIKNPSRLSAAPRHIIAEIKEQAKFQKTHGADDVVGLLGRLVQRYIARTPRLRDSKSLGSVVFYTGQLGAGGAERQLTRIAAGFETIRVEKGELDGVKLTAPFRVAVRHANAESGADFFLPVLENANVQTFLCIDAEKPTIQDLSLNDPDFEKLLTFLPADILDNTLRLVPYFRKHNVEVAYLWQDGGILAAALAALIAEVPSIIVSYRGLPPNLRPDLYRPQLEGLYRSMGKVPGVILNSNCIAAARAYAEWLDHPVDRYKVIYNALVPASTAGDARDLQIWQDIKIRSPDCIHTVVGVFRFDPNKRPVLWVETAAAYLAKHPDTRFIIVGQGSDFAKCTALIKELELEDRIFLVGRSSHVGYWLEKADLLLHLAEFEGLPNVVIEAQIAGLPVIATPAGGTSEAMVHGSTGYCLGSNSDPDIEETLSFIDNVLNTPQKSVEMGQKAHRFTKERFTLERALHGNLRLFVKASP